MTQKYLSGAIPIFGNFPEGFNGWGSDMNRNLLLMSYFVQPSVINTAQITPPSTLVNGTMYIVLSGNTFTSSFYFPGDTAIPANSIVVYDLGGWWYIRPVLGMQVYNQAASAYYKYNGAGWVPVMPTVSGCSYTRLSAYNPPFADARVGFDYKFFNQGGAQWQPEHNYVDITEAGLYDIRFRARYNARIVAGIGISGTIRTNNNTNHIATDASLIIHSNEANSQYLDLNMALVYPFFAGNNLINNVINNISFVIDDFHPDFVFDPLINNIMFSVHKIGDL